MWFLDDVGVPLWHVEHHNVGGAELLPVERVGVREPIGPAQVAPVSLVVAPFRSEAAPRDLDGCRWLSLDLGFLGEDHPL